MSFENLNLHPAIVKAVLAAGYTAPTPIQQQAIPDLIAGHDVMASAQTGTGKQPPSCCRHCIVWPHPHKFADVARAYWF